MSRVKKSWRWV